MKSIFGLLIAGILSFSAASAHAGYIFDPKTIAEITKQAAQFSPTDQAGYDRLYGFVQDQLEQHYPGRIAKGQRWIFNSAGGSLTQITILYCSFNEYLIIYETPINAIGFTGYYKKLNLWDFYIDGSVSTYAEGEHVPTVFKAGEFSFLPANMGRGFQTNNRVSGIEYARGNVLNAFNFGVISSAHSGMLDWHYAFSQIHDCAALAIHRK
jgi:C-8 sterol isomerase